MRPRGGLALIKAAVSVLCVAVVLAACSPAPETKAAAPAPAPAAAAQPDDVAGAEAYVRALYAPYALPQPDEGGAPPQPWSAATKALWVENARLADSVGYLDADPICACRDWLRFALKSVTVTMTGADSADAAVVFDNFAEYQRPQTTHQTLRLVREAGKWVVDDIVWDPQWDLIEGTAMVSGLKASNAELAAAH